MKNIKTAKPQYRRALADMAERHAKDLEARRLYGAEMAKAEVALAIKSGRESAGLSQRELAARLGVTQPYVAEIESGDANLSAEQVGAVLAAMGLRLQCTVTLLEARPVPRAHLVAEGAGTYSIAGVVSKPRRVRTKRT